MNHLINTLDQLRQHGENEIVEFKESDVDLKNELGRYFSALSNEANLMGKDEAWLIWGIDNKTNEIVGTNKLKDSPKLQDLKKSIAENTSCRLTFQEIAELEIEGKRVVMFRIPPALHGTPTSYKGHYYGRNGESLTALNQEEHERILNQKKPDWSAEIIPNATLDDLSPDAIAFARKQFKIKNPHLAGEIDTWNGEKFLDKAKLTIQGQITRTAIILLGNDVSTHFLSPAVAQLTWVLMSEKGIQRDYQHFYPPFLLAVDQVFAKIRNGKYRYMKSGTLFPEEVDRYDSYVIRELLHNCIAHQDYSRRGRINLVEKEEGELIYENVGYFLPGNDIRKVVLNDTPQSIYRNPFLVSAMVGLNMIDMIGSGIPKVFRVQRERFFPMPDYDLSDQKVKVTLYGRILDENYALLLAMRDDLSLREIIALDMVQKRRRLPSKTIVHLRKKSLIEGRVPNVFISKDVAQKTNQKAEYSKFKGFDEQYYRDLLLQALEQHEQLTRPEIDRLLMEKLPDSLTEERKKIKIKNILAKLREKGMIINTGSRTCPCWQLNIDPNSVEKSLDTPD